MKLANSHFFLLPVTFIVLALLATGLVFLVPISGDSPGVHWRAAASTAPVVLLVGAAIIFLGGLESFKAGRAAYRLLAIGMLSFSVLLAQVSIWGLFDLWDSLWATSGAGVLPLALTAGLIYVAARKFSLLLQVKNIFNNVWFAIGITTLIGILMGIFAHYYVKYDIEGTDLYIGVCAWGAACMTWATVLLYKVALAIGPSYQRAMRWLVVSLAAFSVSCWHETISTLWYHNGTTYNDYGYYLIPWSITGLIMLYAGYHFRQITMYPRDETRSSTPPTDSDYIDSVRAVALLISRPEKADTILDDFRGVTASMKPGQPLDEASKQRLVRTYYSLEDYLTTQDPLRTVSREELLSRVTPPFRTLIEHKSSQSA